MPPTGPAPPASVVARCLIRPDDRATIGPTSHSPSAEAATTVRCCRWSGIVHLRHGLVIGWAQYRSNGTVVGVYNCIAKTWTAGDSNPPGVGCQDRPGHHAAARWLGPWWPSAQTLGHQGTSQLGASNYGGTVIVNTMVRPAKRSVTVITISGAVIGTTSIRDRMDTNRRGLCVTRGRVGVFRDEVTLFSMETAMDSATDEDPP